MRQQVELKELCFSTTAERIAHEWIKRKSSAELLLYYLIKKNFCRIQSCCLLKKTKLFKMSMKHIWGSFEKGLFVCLNIELKWDCFFLSICRIFVSRFLHVSWGGLKFWGADFCFLIFMFDVRINHQLSAYKLGLHLKFFHFQFIERTNVQVKTFISYTGRITNPVLHSILLWIS